VNKDVHYKIFKTKIIKAVGPQWSHTNRQSSNILMFKNSTPISGNLRLFWVKISQHENYVKLWSL